MAAFKEPKKFGVIPGNAADVTAIQDAGSVLNPSMTDLFPAIYQLALSAGGKAPERTTFNALFKMIMERLYFIERGGVWSYDATADYPAGAVVGYSGSLYLALKDNGSGTDAGAVQPDADGEVWQKLPTLADVAKAFLLISDAEADYLKKSDASGIYLSKSDAEDTYQTKEDLSSQITTSVRSNWYSNFPDGAEAHNAMWGGRDITASFNNTQCCITDARGNVIAWSSAGKAGFKGSRKSTAFAGTLVAQECAKVAIGKGMHEVEILVQGAGSGRESAIRAIANSGMAVSTIRDITPIPHNGCRQRKRRRV